VIPSADDDYGFLLEIKWEHSKIGRTNYCSLAIDALVCKYDFFAL
jgi:hypothetical protein